MPGFRVLKAGTKMGSLWKNYSGHIKGVKIQPDHKEYMASEALDPTSVKPPYYAPAEKEFISAMQTIALRFGKLADNDDNGIWVGYVNRENNDNYKIGVYCAHCAHYESENVCKIIKAKIEPGGYCRLAAISSDFVKK
jgi:hypothetical protein